MIITNCTWPGEKPATRAQLIRSLRKIMQAHSRIGKCRYQLLSNGKILEQSDDLEHIKRRQKYFSTLLGAKIMLQDTTQPPKKPRGKNYRPEKLTPPRL